MGLFDGIGGFFQGIGRAIGNVFGGNHNAPHPTGAANQGLKTNPTSKTLQVIAGRSAAAPHADLVGSRNAGRLIGDNGSGLIANNAGKVVSDHGLGFISDNGSAFRRG